jgi:hypothetical protein
MVAPAHSTAGLLSSLTTLTKEAPVGEDEGMDREMDWGMNWGMDGEMDGGMDGGVGGCT